MGDKKSHIFSSEKQTKKRHSQLLFGDVVYVTDHDRWPIARVHYVYSASNKFVRVVKLRTAKKIFNWIVRKLSIFLKPKQPICLIKYILTINLSSNFYTFLKVAKFFNLTSWLPAKKSTRCMFQTLTFKFIFVLYFFRQNKHGKCFLLLDLCYWLPAIILNFVQKPSGSA